MKNIKLTLLGTAALLIAVGLNIRHALNDYGVRDNKLHVEVLAQSNGSGGGGSNSGGGSTDGVSCNNTSPRKTALIHCTGTNTVAIIIYDDGKSSNGWQLSGNVNAGWNAVGASLGGKYDQNGSSSSGSNTTTITITGWDFWAEKIYCQNQTSICCKPYNPCTDL